MARSSIEKKAKKKFDPRDIELVEQVTDIAAQYVYEWTSQRVDNLLRKDAKPLIVPTNNGYYIGRYLVKTQKNQWHIYENRIDNIKKLSYRNSAIAFTVYLHLGQFHKANDIAELDFRVSKLELDLCHYLHRLKKASKSRDIPKVLILESRINETKLRLEVEKKRLEKTLNSAKYLKVWDTKT